MASRDDQPDLLYVIHDGERIVVALDMPGVHGAVEERANSAVELARLVPYPVADNGSPLRDSTISQEPPGLRAARAWYGTGAVVGLSAGAVVAQASSVMLGLPLALTALVALALGYRRRRRAVTEAWQRRHRVLRHAEDTHAFTTARQACGEVIDAWSRIGAMVGITDPGPTLARSLWALSGVLVDRGALRDKRDELEQVLVDLPTDTGVWHEVGDRVEQLDAALAAFDGEVDTRLAAFTDLSEHCRRYVREDRAITRAREAVRRADQALSDTLTPVPGEFELADRTAAVLAAYRELTREAPGR
jgi:hypothetical protein